MWWLRSWLHHHSGQIRATSHDPENGWLEDQFPFGMAWVLEAILVIGSVLGGSSSHLVSG